MTTTRQIRSAAVADARRSFNAEWTMAMLVLLTIATSILSSATGHADVEGKAKNGVRRAASQLERKAVKMPMLRVGQVRIG
ncbi:MAG: hypothetical protein ACR2PI_03645 [Hyphomicrobiaceae bacterium]